jgi:hypothetical protein
MPRLKESQNYLKIKGKHTDLAYHPHYGIRLKHNNPRNAQCANTKEDDPKTEIN